MKFVGLRNYQRMFTNTEYIKMFKNCGWYFLVAIPQLIFAFILAVVINGKFRGINIFKGIFIIPYLLNGVIISTIFIIFLAAPRWAEASVAAGPQACKSCDCVHKYLEILRHELHHVLRCIAGYTAGTL